MSNLVQSYAKRGVSTSHSWQWPRRLFFRLAMVLLLPVSQSVAATPLCGAELNLTSVDFCHRSGQCGSVDALNDTAQLKTDGNTLGAEYSSNAELGCRFTPQSSGQAKIIFSGSLFVGKLKGTSTVSGGQIGD